MTVVAATGQVVEVTVEAIGARGDGIAHHGDSAIYIPFTAPGDRLRARLGDRRGDGFAAAMVDLIAPGPGRAQAPCPHFGVCGGCAVQHLAAGPYDDWKRALVQTALAHRGLGEVAVAALRRVSPATRRRASLKAECRRAGDGGATSIVLGFSERGSRRLVNIETCPLLVPGLTAVLPGLRDLLAGLLAPGQRAGIEITASEGGLDMALSWGGALTLEVRERLAKGAEAMDLARLSLRAPGGGPPEPVVARRPVQVVFAGVAVDLPAGAFLQPSAEGAAILVAEVTGRLAGAGRVADLFAGCGMFTFALAREARVFAVEGDADMAAALTAAAPRTGLAPRLSVAVRDLERRPLTPAELAPFDAVVFDPPRAGARAQAAALAESQVGVVVAVSCNPATFARDARMLMDGGYRMEKVTPVDQFLWSPHVEVVAAFRR